MASVMTALLNSTIPTMKLEGFGGFIRPTAIERATGRFMRAPDHDAGGDAGGDAGDAGGDQGDAGAAGDGGDAQSGDVGADADGEGADGRSILEKAGSADGDGSNGEDGGADSDKDGKGDKDAKGEADATPESYELAPLKITADDGSEIEIEIDQTLLDEATPLFKEAGLSNDQANKLAPLALKVQERIVTKQADDFAAMRADWAKEAKADKELGGKNWAETESLAAKALDTFANDDFRKLLTESGFGDHPEMIRAWRKIGEKLSEDTIQVSAEAGKGEKPDRVRTLYPNDLPKAEVK